MKSMFKQKKNFILTAEVCRKFGTRLHFVATTEVFNLSID